MKLYFLLFFFALFSHAFHGLAAIDFTLCKHFVNSCFQNSLPWSKLLDVNLADGVAELPVQFRAKEPGHYPATITLRSNDDIRVYRIECTVNPEGSTAELEFSAPVHQSITQEIPIVSCV